MATDDAIFCTECEERCDPVSPWVHLNPDLDLDHRASPDADEDAARKAHGRGQRVHHGADRPRRATD